MTELRTLKDAIALQPILRQIDSADWAKTSMDAMSLEQWQQLCDRISRNTVLGNALFVRIKLCLWQAGLIEKPECATKERRSP